MNKIFTILAILGLCLAANTAHAAVTTTNDTLVININITINADIDINWASDGSTAARNWNLGLDDTALPFPVETNPTALDINQVYNTFTHNNVDLEIQNDSTILDIALTAVVTDDSALPLPATGWAHANAAGAAEFTIDYSTDGAAPFSSIAVGGTGTVIASPVAPTATVDFELQFGTPSSLTAVTIETPGSIAVTITATVL